MMLAILLVACLVLAAAVVALAVALRGAHGRLVDLERDRGSRRAEPASGPDTTPVELVETRRAEPSSDDYVITRLGQAEEPTPSLEPRLFADVVLRESVVKAASLVHGVRRGLAPANRNRIWFEMRREVRRARKHRKAEEREAVREWRARRRAAVREDDAA